MTGGWLDVLAKVVALLSPFILVYLGWVFKRRLDAAQAKLAEAQARASDASVEKTRAETSGLVVSNAVSAAEKLVALYQAQQERDARIAAEAQARKDEENAAFKESATTRIHHLEKQVGDLQHQQHQLATSLVPHAIWDGRIWHEIRHFKPDYDPPPAFGLDGLAPTADPNPDSENADPAG